ncbi:MAG: type II secretion system F family protein [Bacillota bacterium]
MPQYSYRASDSRGEIRTGIIGADTRQEAMASLRIQDLFPLELLETTREKMEEEAVRQSGGVKRKELLIFTQQLASLLKSGVRLDRALLICAELFKQRRIGAIIEEIWQEVQAGKAFSDSLAMHPHVFPVFFQNMVKAGEFSGVLPLVLERLAAFLEEEYELRLFLWSSLLYPAMISLVSMGALGVVLFFVIPKFEQIFKMMHKDLPLITRVVLWLSNVLQVWWWVPVIMLAGAGTALCLFWNSPQGREKIDRWRLTAPLFGDIYLKVQTARMARTFGTMLSGGVPILKALSILQGSMNNIILAGAVGEIHSSLREGGSIAREMKKQRVFPTIAVHMLAIGEESSDIEGMLEKLAKLYDTEVKNTLRGLLSILEPAVILFLAVGIFLLLISILIPLMRMGNIL